MVMRNQKSIRRSLVPSPSPSPSPSLGSPELPPPLDQWFRDHLLVGPCYVMVPFHGGTICYPNNDQISCMLSISGITSHPQVVSISQPSCYFMTNLVPHQICPPEPNGRRITGFQKKKKGGGGQRRKPHPF